MYGSGDYSGGNSTDNGPEHLFFNDVEELHPWRMPVDCISGCMALPNSVDLLLRNVAAAREKSLGTMYKVKPNLSVNTSSTYDEAPATTMVLKSKRSQRRAAEKVSGTTLLDLARNSTNASGGFSPQKESGLSSLDHALTRTELSPSSAEVVRTSVNGDLLHTSASSRGGNATAGLPTYAAVQGNKGRGQYHSISQSQSYVVDRSSQFLEAASMPSAHDTVLGTEKETSPLWASQPQPVPPSQRTSSQQSLSLKKSDRRSTSSPTPVVPEIPNFVKCLSEKEQALKQLESSSHASSGKYASPVAAATAAAAHGKGSCDDEEVNDVHDYQDMVNAASNEFVHLHSASSSPSPPSVAPLTGHRAGRQEYPVPAHSNSDVNPSASDQQNPQPTIPSSSSSSSSEMEAEHASEGNFGENGHYVCVPGDTLHNRYTLIHQLGTGRSSRVWLAVDLDQCSPSRRQLIKSFGEEKVRKLFNPKERPMFVAIKIFRCGQQYTDCAKYESRMMEYIKEYLKGSGVAGRRRQSMLEASYNPGDSTMPESIFAGLSSGQGSTGGGGASHVNPAASGGHGTWSHQRLSSIGSASGWSANGGLGASIGLSGSGGGPIAGMSTSGYSNHLALMRDHFTVEGDYGTHHCIVMDVVGAGVDEAINETRLRGLPLDVVRSIMTTSLQGLAVLDALHIIHTDIKPENLLFIDLEEKTANEMDAFQRSKLDTGGSLRLWNNSVHRRMSVADYAALTASTRSHDAELIRGSLHDEGDEGLRPPHETQEAAKKPSPSELSFNSASADAPSADRHARRFSGNQCRQWSPSQACTGDDGGEARTLYEVRVSDYGLSFIVPPALRDGLETMKALSKECIEAQKQRREDERLGVKRSASLAKDRKSGTGSTEAASQKRGRLGRARAAAAAAAEAESDDDAESPPSVDENNEDGDCVLSLDPKEQLKAMCRHQEKLLDNAAQSRAQDEEDAPTPTRGGGTADLGSSSPRDRYSWRRTHLGLAAARAKRALTDTELSILREQVYARGITIQSREYRAPEVILGMYFLPSCDVWSIGCVAYELVTGHFLFDTAEEYELAMDKCVERRKAQRREQRRRLRRRPVYHNEDLDDDEDDEDNEDDGDGEGRYNRRGQRRHRNRNSSSNDDDDEQQEHDHDDSSSDEFDPEEDLLLNAPMYFDDNPETDMDVVHLKSMMRLLGPPPLSLLNRPPCGVFVDRFFDASGNFHFLENDDVYENEEKQFGFTAAARFRAAELYQMGLGGYFIPPGTSSILNESAHGHSGFQQQQYTRSPPEARFANTITAGMRGSSQGNAIMYHYSDDDEDEFQKELAKTVGGTAVVHHVHSTTTTNNSAEQTRRRANEDEEVTPSSTIMTPGSAPTRSLALPENEFVNRSGSPYFGTNTISTLPELDTTCAGYGYGPVDGRNPSDTTNYPIATQGWQTLQETIRDYLDSEDEAQSFEEFLLMCFQWDPEKRAKASDLLKSRWMTQYGPLATTAHLNHAADDE